MAIKNATALGTQFYQELLEIVARARKSDKVRRWQELSAAAAFVDAEMKALKEGILEANDQRFKIIEETTRESAPTKADYIRIHGEDAFEENKKVTTVKRHVKGIA